MPVALDRPPRATAFVPVALAKAPIAVARSNAVAFVPNAVAPSPFAVALEPNDEVKLPSASAFSPKQVAPSPFAVQLKLGAIILTDGGTTAVSTMIFPSSSTVRYCLPPGWPDEPGLLANPGKK